MFFFVVVVVVVFVVANVRINRRDFVQVGGFSSGAHLGECLEANGSQRWQGPQIIYKNWPDGALVGGSVEKGVLVQSDLKQK